MSEPTPPPLCPCCGGRLWRVPRSFGDRCLSLFVPVLRCRCETMNCGWEGLFRNSLPGSRGEPPGSGYRADEVLEPSRDVGPPPAGTARR